MIIIDIYTFRGISSVYKNKKSKKYRWFKYIYWQVTVLSVLMALYLLYNLKASHGLRVYGGGMVFVIYLSKLFLVVFLLLDDFGRGFKWLYRKMLSPAPLPKSEAMPEIANDSEKITRQAFLVKTGMIASAAPLILLSNGIMNNAHDYKVHRIPIKIPNLPDAFRGLKIVQVSDIHSGSFVSRDGVARGVGMIRALKPDIIFFTGDLVNNSTDEVYPWMDILSQVQAPMGVLSTLGNHDYGDYKEWPDQAAKEANLEALYQAHADMGWHLMRNEHVTLDLHGQRIGIVGVENWGHQKRFQKYGDLAKATKNMPDVPVKILLSHDPSHWDLKVRKETPEIDLMLSGHTHGFQFGIETPWFRFSPSQWVYKQWAGLYAEGRQQLYVNRGFGFLGYPGRVGIMPEITLLELV